MKTVPTDRSVDDFLAAQPLDIRRQDGQVLIEMMRRVTGEEPVLWGTSIVGFGSYHYKYASGREGDFMLTGFSPRKAAMSIYIMPGFSKYGDLMDVLGKHKTGRSCLYVKKLADVDMAVLEELVRRSVIWMRGHYPTAP